MVNDRGSSTLAFMREIFAYLSTSNSTYNLIHSIHESLKTVLYAENFFVVLVSSSERYVTFPYYQDSIDNMSLDELNLVPLEKLFKTLTLYAIKKKKIVCLNRTQIEALETKGEVKVLGTMPEQWLCFPLAHQGEFLGNFVVQSYRDSTEYSQHDIDVLTLISNVIAASLFLFRQNAQLSDTLEELQQHKDLLEIKVHERTRELESTLGVLQVEIDKSKELEQQLTFLAFHDSLTKLYNRKYFIDQMDVMASKSYRERSEAILAFLDLDDFKSINDKYGHACGDYVLQTTAKRLKTCFRRHDVIARFGGDEFVVLINNAISSDDLTVLLDRVVFLLSSEIKYKKDEDVIHVSIGVSLGIAVCNHYKVNVNNVLEQADKALYQAKERGKGCYVFSHNN
jgi:diguanylate cyclase (GGDEF)-like protein